MNAWTMPGLLLVIGSLLLNPSVGWSAGEGIDSIMLRDPVLEEPKVVPVFPESLVKVWLDLLERPEADYKIRAAETIAEAHRRGMKNLEVTIPKLVAELERNGVSAPVRIGIVQALAELDAKEAATAMFRAAQDGNIDVRQIVDPCLTRWLYEPVRSSWLERLSQPNSQRGTILAIRGLLAAQDARAIPRLLEIARNEKELAPIRLEAARAVGELRPTGLEGEAKQLAARSGLSGTISRVVAATLLQYHNSDSAIALLQAMVRDPEPTVALRALTRLVALQPQHVAPVLDLALAYPDAAVRLQAVEGLDKNPTVPNLRKLADRMADVHPEVRTRARVALRKHYETPTLQETIRQETMRILSSEFWGGLQQAALLAGQIDYKPAIRRLLPLQDHERSEVFVTAAWSLRVLNQTETLEPTHEIFKRRLKFINENMPKMSQKTMLGYDEQLSQLAQFLGQRKYAPASTVFQKLIPLNSGPIETRSAAIWGLGKIHEGQQDIGFEVLVENRLNAVNPGDVEMPLLRRMCALTLGRVKADITLPSLRRYYSGKPMNDEVNNACGWAIERITGAKYPQPEPTPRPQIDFFAIPLPKDGQ